MRLLWTIVKPIHITLQKIGTGWEQNFKAKKLLEKIEKKIAKIKIIQTIDITVWNDILTFK